MMQKQPIIVAAPDRFEELIVIWEASVRATHDFLPEHHIASLRPLILSTYLPSLLVHAYQDAAGHAMGFTAVANNKLEMLFVAPSARGRGIGKALLLHAIDALGVTELDVNEQNPQAAGFYRHMGFVVAGRSPIDGQGNPYPLLHLKRN